MKSENISIDNNLEILSKLNPKENSLTYTTKNNDNKNIHRTSILSSKVNNQNLKYNYLNNLPLEEKIKYRKRSNWQFSLLGWNLSGIIIQGTYLTKKIHTKVPTLYTFSGQIQTGHIRTPQ